MNCWSYLKDLACARAVLSGNPQCAPRCEGRTYFTFFTLQPGQMVTSALRAFINSQGVR
jgi:hypothetical protein